uniref:Uncharacterized protein n=1 Tax=Salix viminalis TaxID=40686 RepID=A0A6N2MQ69_SALVM
MLLHSIILGARIHRVKYSAALFRPQYSWTFIVQTDLLSVIKLHLHGVGIETSLYRKRGHATSTDEPTSGLLGRACILCLTFLFSIITGFKHLPNQSCYDLASTTCFLRVDVPAISKRNVGEEYTVKTAMS